MTSIALPDTAIRQRTLSPRLAYALSGGIIGLALLASGTPSPLYGVYRELWGFSPVVLTLVYATYAFGVLTTLFSFALLIVYAVLMSLSVRRAQRSLVQEEA